MDKYQTLLSVFLLSESLFSVQGLSPTVTTEAVLENVTRGSVRVLSPCLAVVRGPGVEGLEVGVESVGAEVDFGVETDGGPKPAASLIRLTEVEVPAEVEGVMVEVAVGGTTAAQAVTTGSSAGWSRLMPISLVTLSTRISATLFGRSPDPLPRKKEPDFLAGDEGTEKVPVSFESLVLWSGSPGTVKNRIPESKEPEDGSSWLKAFVSRSLLGLVSFWSKADRKILLLRKLALLFSSGRCSCGWLPSSSMLSCRGVAEIP